MNLDHSNYYTPEADRRYLSNSSYKAWMECAAKKAAVLAGKWQDEETMAQTIGKYVDTALLTPSSFCASR